MTPQELKNSILQLAIQGKLVEQRAEEGTGRELLEKILAAKNAKDAEKGKGTGRLTRSRGDRGDAPTSAPSASPRDEIPDDEKPFDIPESWEWVRLGELAQSIQYGYNASAKKNGRIKFVRISDIHDGDVLWDSVPYCDINENDIETYRLRTNDILFARTGGTVGKSYLVRTLPVDAVYAGYLIRARYGSGLSSEYIKYFMESPLYWKQLKIGTIATAQPNCNGKTLAKMLLPLPPLAEQKRIVAKIEELLPLIDRYEKAWSRLESFNKSFPVDMQKSILQMAIQGKLVEQRAEEGTGRELLEKILAAKNAKDAEKGKGRGRLTRSRGDRGDAPTSAPSASPRDEIPDDEKPFDIPDSWEWVRLGEIADINGGFAFKSTNYTSKGVRVIRISDFIETGFVNDKIVRYSYDETLKPYILEEKNILLCMTGGTVGKSLFVPKMNELMVVNQRVAMIKVRDAIPEYVYKVILAPITQKVIQDSKNSTNDNISMDTIKGFLIPLPPLAEQKRIVAKLEELLPLCERLK